MKELVVTGVLYLGIVMPGQAEHPPDWLLREANRLPLPLKQRVARFITSCGLYDPTAEYEGLIAWKCFDGAYCVLWRRAAGRPFNYPTDPLGPRGPR